MSTHPAHVKARLATPVREFMRPGVTTIPEHASLVRHGIHAVLVVANADGRPLGWVTAEGLLSWLERDLSAVQASHAITEPPHRVDPDETAHGALAALSAPGVSHLLVCAPGDGPAQGVVAPIDLVELVTRP
jgi:CBS domain-containing protein